MPPGTGTKEDAIAFSGIKGPTAGAKSKTRAEINRPNTPPPGSGDGGAAARAARKAAAKAKAKKKAQDDLAANVAAQDKRDAAEAKAKAKRVNDATKTREEQTRKASAAKRAKAQADKVKAEARKASAAKDAEINAEAKRLADQGVIESAKLRKHLADKEAADKANSVESGLLSNDVKITPLADANVVEESNNPFSGVGDWFGNLFGDTSNDTEEEKSDSVGSMLKNIANPIGSLARNIFKESQTGMNDIAKDEWALLNKEASRDPNSPWHTMSDAEKASLARKPQIDKQLPHAFIDGHPNTPIQKEIAKLTGGKSPSSTVYNADGSVNIAATAQTVRGNGGGNAGGASAPAPVAAPKWWEPGYEAPGNGGDGGIWTPGPNPPQFGGGQQVPGLPDYLQRELAQTPDFTGTFQSSLLGNTALPSQQITGLLAPPQQPQQQQIDPNQIAGLLRGFI